MPPPALRRSPRLGATLPGSGVAAPAPSSDPAGWSVAPVARGALALFLALYLLLLAFFIMLNALSSLESRRADAVMDSLSETFSRAGGVRGPASGALPLDDLAGLGRAAETFIAVVSDLFQAVMPAARIVQVTPGRDVELLVRAEALFEPDAADLRPSRLAMLDSIVAALAVAPPGLRFEMEAILQTGPAQAATPPLPTAADTLAVRRAGTVGRTMMARGATPGSVVVGLGPGDPDWMRLAFRAVDVSRSDPDFGAVPADAVPIDPPPPADTEEGAQSDPGGDSIPQGQSRIPDVGPVEPGPAPARPDEAVSAPVDPQWME